MVLAKVDDTQGFSRVVCALPHVQLVFPDDTAHWENDDRIPQEVECGQEVTVTWRADHGITPGTSVTAEEMQHGHKTAWEARCARGHVLAVSSGEDFAETFDPARVLGI